jgi:hypothetical protein
MLGLRFRFRRDVLRAAAIGERQAFAHEKGADVNAARRADRELARVPVDEVVIDVAGEVGICHELAQPRRRHLAARPGRARGVAAGLLRLEGVDAVETEPFADASDAKTTPPAAGRPPRQGVAVEDAVLDAAGCRLRPAEHAPPGNGHQDQQGKPAQRAAQPPRPLRT